MQFEAEYYAELRLDQLILRQPAHTARNIFLSEVKEVVSCYEASKRGRAVTQTQGCLCLGSVFLISIFKDKII